MLPNIFSKSFHYPSLKQFWEKSSIDHNFNRQSNNTAFEFDFASFTENTRTAQEKRQHEIEDDMLNKVYPKKRESPELYEVEISIGKVLSSLSGKSGENQGQKFQSLRVRPKLIAFPVNFQPISQPSSGDRKVCFSFIAV